MESCFVLFFKGVCYVPNKEHKVHNGHADRTLFMVPAAAPRLSFCIQPALLASHSRFSNKLLEQPHNVFCFSQWARFSLAVSWCDSLGWSTLLLAPAPNLVQSTPLNPALSLHCPAEIQVLLLCLYIRQFLPALLKRRKKSHFHIIKCGCFS